MGVWSDVVVIWLLGLWAEVVGEVEAWEFVRAGTAEATGEGATGVVPFARANAGEAIAQMTRVLQVAALCL